MLKKLIFSLFFILFIFVNATAQMNFEQDLSLILKSENSKIRKIETERNKKREFLIAKDAPLVEKLNPVRWTLGGLLYFYQTSLSKHFSADCLYEPSCSNFSKDVIQHYGLLKGVFLTADRLSRCNRIAQTSLHPLTIDPNTGRSTDGYTKYRFRIHE
jgi:putative membrane protein insertion efficiency factor